MNVCAYCGSESNSISAMIACEESCGEDQRNTFGYFKRDNPNHRAI